MYELSGSEGGDGERLPHKGSKQQTVSGDTRIVSTTPRRSHPASWPGQEVARRTQEGGLRCLEVRGGQKLTQLTQLAHWLETCLVTLVRSLSQPRGLCTHSVHLYSWPGETPGRDISQVMTPLFWFTESPEC